MIKIFAKPFLTLATASLAVSGLAYADVVSCGAGCTISGSPFSPIPPAGGGITALNLQGISTPSGPTTINGNGYTITADVAVQPPLSTGTDQGVVQNSVPSVFPNGVPGGTGHAVPVAGVDASGNALYLTDDFGSSLTSDINMSGNYLSTGSTGSPGTGTGITITFATPEPELALLWGSIDATNMLTFLDANGNVIDTVTGAEAAASAEEMDNGGQGPGGSTWALIDPSAPFTSVVASNPDPTFITSFEFAGVAAGSGFSLVPEPSFFWLLSVGFGITVAVVIGRRRQRAVLPS